MKYFYIYLTLAFLSLSTCYSQNYYPNNELAKEVLKTTLVVEINDEKTDTDKYVNIAIKEIFTNNWENSKVIFHTREEINKLKNESTEGYSFLIGNDALSKDIRTNYINPTGKINTNVGIGQNSIGDYQYKYDAFVFSYFEYLLQTYENGKIVTALRIGLANNELTKIDYLYICQQIKNLIENSANNIPEHEFYNVVENIEQIKTSKLLLLNDYFKEKDIKKMSKYYDYQYEIVDMEEYQNAILNKKENNLYLKIIWSKQNKLYVWVVVDAVNGKIKAITAFGGIQFGRYHDANEIIKAKHLKYITSKFAQKLNSRYKKK